MRAFLGGCEGNGVATEEGGENEKKEGLEKKVWVNEEVGHERDFEEDAAEVW